MALALTPHTKHATHLHIQQADTTQEAKWDMFDDSQVSFMSTKNVLELGQGDKGWHSPYILVYEKQARKCGADHVPLTAQPGPPVDSNAEDQQGIVSVSTHAAVAATVSAAEDFCGAEYVDVASLSQKLDSYLSDPSDDDEPKGQAKVVDRIMHDVFDDVGDDSSIKYVDLPSDDSDGFIGSNSSDESAPQDGLKPGESAPYDDTARGHEPPQAVSTPTSAVARRKSDKALEAFVDKCRVQELFFSRPHTNTDNTMVSGEVLCCGEVLSAIANTHESRPYVYGVALESSSKDSKNVRQNTQPHPRPKVNQPTTPSDQHNTLPPAYVFSTGHHELESENSWQILHHQI